MNPGKRGTGYWQFSLVALLPIILLGTITYSECASVSVRTGPASGSSGVSLMDLDEMVRNLQCVSGPCGATSFRCPSESCSYHYKYCSKAKRQTVCCC